MSPHSCSPLLPYTQLPLRIQPTTINIAPLSQTKRMIGSSCHHSHHLTQHRLHQDRFIFVLCMTQTQLPLRTKTANINMTFVCEYQWVFSSKSYLFNFSLLLQSWWKIILNLNCKVKKNFFGCCCVIFSSCPQLTKITLPKSIQFFISSQHHCMIIPASYLLSPFVLEKLD